MFEVVLAVTWGLLSVLSTFVFTYFWVSLSFMKQMELSHAEQPADCINRCSCHSGTCGVDQEKAAEEIASILRITQR